MCDDVKRRRRRARSPGSWIRVTTQSALPAGSSQTVRVFMTEHSTTDRLKQLTQQLVICWVRKTVRRSSSTGVPQNASCTAAAGTRVARSTAMSLLGLVAVLCTRYNGPLCWRRSSSVVPPAHAPTHARTGAETAQVCAMSTVPEGPVASLIVGRPSFFY